MPSPAAAPAAEGARSGDAEVERPISDKEPRRGLRLQDHRRSLRRPPLVLQGVLRRVEERRRTGLERPQRQPGTPGAHRRAAGQDDHAGERTPRRRHRRRGQAEGRAHRRHAVPRRATRSRSRRSRCPSRPSPTPSPPRAATTRTAWATPCRGSSKRIPACASIAIRRPRSSCSPAAAQQHVEIVVSRLKRRYSVDVELQRSQDPLPRDHPRQRRRPGPPQEADRRSRPVRRHAWSRWSRCERGGGLRVRQRHLRRLGPAQLHSRGREGHHRGRRAGLPGRLPDGGLQGDAVRRPVPRRRLLGNVVQDGRPQGLQARPWRRPSRPCSSRS